MAPEELSSPPSLAGLYAKVVVNSLLALGRPEVLPERRLALREVEIDLDRLARYARVCGYALGSSLPPTYPHLLGFPLALELMGSRSFPFGVLGAVHAANRIDQREAIPAAARPDVLVWAQDLRPHRRGMQFDVVTQLEVAGRAVWREVGTYVRPGAGGERTEAGSGDEGEARSEKDERAGSDRASKAGAGGSPGRDGRPVGRVAAVWSIRGDIGRRYGSISGDRNPIHMHSLAAKPFGFDRAIAHGMWMNARCLAALEARLGEAFVAAVEFRRPLRIPGRVALRIAERSGGFDLTLEAPDDGRAYLTGSVRSQA
jgi:hypothetical protein